MKRYDLEDIVGLFDKTEKSDMYVVDFFPHTIAENEKFMQVELFYKRPLKLSNMKFKRLEEQMFCFIVTLWLYSDVSICLFDFKGTPKNFIVHKRLKKNFRFDGFVEIRNKKYLQQAVKSLCREFTDAYIVFDGLFGNLAVLYLNGLSGLLYVPHKQCFEEIEKIASRCGMYLRPSGANG